MDERRFDVLSSQLYQFNICCPARVIQLHFQQLFCRIIRLLAVFGLSPVGFSEDCFPCGLVFKYFPCAFLGER